MSTHQLIDLLMACRDFSLLVRESETDGWTDSEMTQTGPSEISGCTLLAMDISGATMRQTLLAKQP